MRCILRKVHIIMVRTYVGDGELLPSGPIRNYILLVRRQVSELLDPGTSCVVSAMAAPRTERTIGWTIGDTATTSQPVVS